jgi:N utilization substance protein A
MAAIAANRTELLQIADAVARDKSIDKMVVLHAMEEAMQRAAKARYGSENDIRVEIDPKTGETRVSRYLQVVELVDNDKTEISLEDARLRNPAAQVDDIIAETLPPVDFSRIAAQGAKQVIVQKVRDAERERQFEEYKDRIGEVIHGIVKRVEFGSVVVDLGRAEGVVRRDEMIPREAFRTGDRIRAYIYDVRRETRGPQIFLSRSHPQFMVRLFAQEVPEIYDGIIEIRAVARDPGSRAKIAVISKDSSIDPVGACVGMRGVRVQAVVQELQGERIDIIPWSEDPATFIVNALAPAEVTKVVLDEDTARVEVVVPDEQLSLAIGRRGQNVRLASQLTGWQIDILTEAEESERRQKEFAERTSLFMEALDVDEMVAQLLASEGFADIEDVAYVPLVELSSVEGFDEETAEELQTRALEHLEARNKELDDKRRELGVKDEVLEVEGVTAPMAVSLGENEIKTLEDLAGCATDDLLGYYEVNKDKERVKIVGALENFDLTPDDANAIIMKARVKAGWIDEWPEAGEEASEEASEEPVEAEAGEESLIEGEVAEAEIAADQPEVEGETEA